MRLIFLSLHQTLTNVQMEMTTVMITPHVRTPPAPLSVPATQDGLEMENFAQVRAS